ncbi:glycosyltransferase [Prolixibacteraceae bacterium JC049]|nr:glycosyltransferase [Prolixibacteraceae bacterium JC049]
MEKNKRVCHITSMDNWRDARIFERACLGLARNGFEVSFIVTTPDENVVESDYPVSFLWLKKRDGIRRRIFSSIEAIEKAISIDADIYHFHDPEILFFVNKLRKRKPKAKIIFDIHENYRGRFEMWKKTRLFSPILKKLYSWAETYMMHKINGYVVVSDSMKLIYKDVKVPGTVVRNTIYFPNYSDFIINEDKDETLKRIITSGSHSYQRHVVQTVAAIKYINTKEKIVFNFVGKYKLNAEEQIQKQIEKDNIQDYVTLDGMLTRQKNIERISESFCGCVFYEDNPNNRVGIPNRIFEYMFAGIPIVVSDFPELRKIITEADCGVVVDSSNPHSIAEGIQFLLDHPDKAKMMGENGRKALETTMNYQVDLETLINFYADV